MTEETKGNGKKIISTLFKLVLGLAFLALGVWAIYVWWQDLLVLVRASIGLFLILVGIITLAIAKE